MKQGGPPPPQPPCSAPPSHDPTGSPPLSQPNQGQGQSLSGGIKQQPSSFLEDGTPSCGGELGQGSPQPQHGSSLPAQNPGTPMLAPVSSPHQTGAGGTLWSDLGSATSQMSQHHQNINSAYMSHYPSWYGQSNGLSHQQSLLT